MIRTDIEITLTLQGPIMSQSSEPGLPGYDMVVACNQDNIPYIAGTLISGKLDQAWQEIIDAVGAESTFQPKIEKWLGAKKEHHFPQAKQLYFSDFLLQGAVPESDSLHRISIDDERGAAKQHHLLTIECPFKSGSQYDFQGTLTFFSNDDNTEADGICWYVTKGLRWLEQLGALRSTGFGRLRQVRVVHNKKTIPQPTASSSLNANGTIRFLLVPEQPFCIAKKPLADNLYESQDTIPGAAILGSIAATWGHMAGDSSGRINNIRDSDRKELKEYFNSIRISHAFPSVQKLQRPVTFPFSLVKVGQDGSLFDLATQAAPCLINGEVPQFAIDWKSDKDVKSKFGWAAPDRELRVRTAILATTLSAEENKLFSYEQVVPKGNFWHGELDLSRLENSVRQTVFEQLASLMAQGGMGLGKTKTPYRIEFDNASGIQPAMQSNNNTLPGNRWIITLQTDTLLGVPENLIENTNQRNLAEMYQHAWSNLSKHVRLVQDSYFARQKLAGGRYLYNVFGKRQSPGEYCPWLLTEAGSVFVLEAIGDLDKARNDIETWLHYGLPLGNEVMAYYRIDNDSARQWQTCPYLPQNGYGEIAVNLAVHTANKLHPDSVEPIDILTPTEEMNHVAS